MTTTQIECDYFSLPRPDDLTEVISDPEHQTLYFERGPCAGEIEIEMVWYTEEERNIKDFPEFCYHHFIAEDEERLTELHIETLSVDTHAAWCARAREGETFGLTAAIATGQYGCLAFFASYEIDEALAASSTDHLLEMQIEMNRWLLGILHSLHIKTRGIREEERRSEQQEVEIEHTAQARMRMHKRNYTTAGVQAADPFHAWHYPDRFSELEAELANYQLSQTALDGIYTNARLSIAYIPDGYDDYRVKGNTRFFGLPDLPPGVAYPTVEPGPKAQAGNLYKFIAQINFAELAGMQDYFPDHGILYFFVKSVWLPLQENFPHQVFYYDGDVDALQSAKDLGLTPAQTFDASHDYEDRQGEPPYRMRVVPFVNILDSQEDVDEEYYVDYPPAIFDAPIAGINRALMQQKNIFSQMEFQHAHSVDVETSNANVDKMYHGGPYVQAARALGGTPEDYVVLLNTENYGADADVLYFVIAKERLKALDFSKVYCSSTWWD